MSKRVPIPKDIEAEILFGSDHVCCICRDRTKTVQIHHIDSNNSNNIKANLAVLCLSDHDRASTKSKISKGLTPKEIQKYKESWEKLVIESRKSIDLSYHAQLVRFDGEDVDTIYLDVGNNILRAFQDPDTFDALGFQWGNVDLYTDADKRKFTISDPLRTLKNSRKIRVRFKNGNRANEVYVVWDDGRKHHIPDPDTLEELGGFQSVEDVDYLEYNSIPHGTKIIDIFTRRNRDLLREMMKEASTTDLSVTEPSFQKTAYQGGSHKINVEVLNDEHDSFTLSVTSTAVGMWGINDQNVFPTLQELAKLIIAGHRRGTPYQKEYSFNSDYKSLDEAANWIKRNHV